MAARSGRGAAPGSGPGGSTGRERRRPGRPAPTTRRTTRVEPAESVPLQRGTSTFTSRALILLLVVAVLGVSYASSIRAWLNQREEQASLSSQIATQRAQIAALQTAKGRWSDPAYIEAQARLRFGWVMPGERSYRVIGKNGKVLSAGHSELSTVVPGSPTQSLPWWQGTLDSLVHAGTTAPPVQKPQPVRHPAKLIGPSPDTSSGR